MAILFLLIKLDKAYTHKKKIEFTRSQRGEKVIPAQREIALSISLLKLSIKEQTIEQQEELCKELYSDNPLKFWDKDKIFTKNYFVKPKHYHPRQTNGVHTSRYSRV